MTVLLQKNFPTSNFTTRSEKKVGFQSKWSKQLSAGKLDSSAQKKLGEIMSQMSKVLHDMSMQDQGDMQMEYHNKIMEMEKA